MRQQQNNAAYDFQRFAPATAPQKAPDKKMPAQPQIVRKRAKNKRVIRQEEQMAAKKSLKMIASAMLVLLFLGVFLYSNVRLNELDYEIDNVSRDIAIIQSENKRLQMQLNGMASLDSVEKYAVNQLGMSKVENYQKKYITLEKEDSIVKAGGKETKSDAQKNVIKKEKLALN